VVSNLVNNALSYGTPSRPVRIASQVSSAAVELCVQNEGTPIPEAMQAQIFEPMQRGTGAGNSGRSIGLGLYIVREIVQAHGGSIVLSSTEEAGTRFVVTLPNQPNA
jgi:sigma-B regulation protein RsbU (phosphoserine phosphatase)